MRTKSEEKKREIVRVAAKAFEELGYDRTSMLTIAERMKGSKQTLYNYFPSKEDLLRAVLEEGVAEASEQSLAVFMAEAERDLRGALIRGAVAYLEHQLAPSTIALIRTAANLPAESGIGASFYREAIRPAWQHVAGCFESLMEAGLLRRADPWLAGQQYKALALLDLYERHLLGAAAAASRKEIEQVAASAADAFLLIYAPAPANKGTRARGVKA